MKCKFKAGDLVTLSAAGKRMNQNMDCIGGFGFVETILPEGDSDYPIRCKWWKKDMKTINMNFKPYELKFFKKNT